MFEQRLEEMTASVHVDKRESMLADEHGVTVPPGATILTFKQASGIVAALDRRIAGGFTYKSIENRMKSLRNSMLWAFGPEGEAAYISARKKGESENYQHKGRTTC